MTLVTYSHACAIFRAHSIVFLEQDPCLFASDPKLIWKDEDWTPESLGALPGSSGSVEVLHRQKLSPVAVWRSEIGYEG